MQEIEKSNYGLSSDFLGEALKKSYGEKEVKNGGFWGYGQCEENLKKFFSTPKFMKDIF